jgi:hypothetical protein
VLGDVFFNFVFQGFFFLLTLVSHAGKMAVPWRRQVKNGYRLKATCQETAWVPLWNKADKDKYSTFPSGFYCTNVTGATCLVRAALLRVGGLICVPSNDDGQKAVVVTGIILSYYGHIFGYVYFNLLFVLICFRCCG